MYLIILKKRRRSLLVKIKQTILHSFFNKTKDIEAPRKDDMNSIQKYLSNIDESYIDINQLYCDNT